MTKRQKIAALKKAIILDSLGTYKGQQAAAALRVKVRRAITLEIEDYPLSHPHLYQLRGKQLVDLIFAQLLAEAQP